MCRLVPAGSLVNTIRSTKQIPEATNSLWLFLLHYRKRAVSKQFLNILQKNEGNGGAWSGGDLSVAGGRKQGVFRLEFLWINQLVKVVRRKALESLIKIVEERDSWLEGDGEKFKAAGLKSLDDKWGIGWFYVLPFQANPDCNILILNGQVWKVSWVGVRPSDSPAQKHGQECWHQTRNM